MNIEESLNLKKGDRVFFRGNPEVTLHVKGRDNIGLIVRNKKSGVSFYILQPNVIVKKES